MLESNFQSKLIKKIKEIFPDSFVLKNDASYKQGVPDLTIFNGSKWAFLECKRKENSQRQPNQEYYIDKLGRMGYAKFIYPENRDQVLDELKCYFEDV